MGIELLTERHKEQITGELSCFDRVLLFGTVQAELAAIYGNLTQTAIHTVKPDNIATFLGRKLHAQFEGEAGNRFNIGIEGTRIKHTMGPVSLKLYDKFSLILPNRDNRQRSDFFQALPPGRTSRRHEGNQVGADAENHL